MNIYILKCLHVLCNTQLTSSTTFDFSSIYSVESLLFSFGEYFPFSFTVTSILFISEPDNAVIKPEQSEHITFVQSIKYEMVQQDNAHYHGCVATNVLVLSEILILQNVLWTSLKRQHTEIFGHSRRLSERNYDTVGNSWQWKTNKRAKRKTVYVVNKL